MNTESKKLGANEETLLKAERIILDKEKAQFEEEKKNHQCELDKAHTDGVNAGCLLMLRYIVYCMYTGDINSEIPELKFSKLRHELTMYLNGHIDILSNVRNLNLGQFAMFTKNYPSSLNRDIAESQ